MQHSLPHIYLARHGETAWSLTGQHTGRTDIPLTPRGETNARQLGERLRGMQFAHVFTSPLVRARRTAELAGFPNAVPEADLLEYDYGQYEGLKTAEIRQQRPDWDLFRDGCPGGETVEQIGARADHLFTRLRALPPGDVILFAHGHVLRVLVARWLLLPPIEARRFLLSTAALSILGYEHNRLEEPALALWNDTRHVAG